MIVWFSFFLFYFQSHGDNLASSQDSGEGGGSDSIINTMTSRVKLNFKVLGVQVEVTLLHLLNVKS